MRFCILILLVIGVTDQARSFRGLRKKGKRNYNTIPDHSNMRIIKKVNGFQKLIGNSGSSGMLATCDLVFFSETVDFDTAEGRCNNFTLGGNQEGHLATVNDKEKNEALKILLNIAYPNQPSENEDMMWGPENWVWAGLRKFQNLDKKKYKSKDWKWADESIPKRFNKWYDAKQPDQTKLNPGKKGCPADGEVCSQNQMRINSEGLWDDTYKFKKHPYACDYQGKYILSTDRVHFWEAKKRCEATGLYMAQITTEADYEELVTAARYFLGEPKAGKWTDGNWFWMGAADVMHEGNWTWIYNSRDVTLKSEWWEDDMPDNSRSQDGLALSIAGKFDDQDMKKKNAIACQCSPPINGGWSDYDPDWSVCPDTCGEHEQTKNRTCTNPAPANGGNECVGDASLTQLCNTTDCSDGNENCPAGYTWFNAIPDLKVNPYLDNLMNTKNECESVCNSDGSCKSFVYSINNEDCYTFAISNPGGVLQHGDYEFCSKNENEICPAGYTHMIGGHDDYDDSLYGVDAPTISDCKPECDSDDDCKSFEYAVEVEKCYLYDFTNPDDDQYDGYVFCSKNVNEKCPTGYTYLLGSTSDNPLNFFTVDTQSECEYKCSSNEDCKSFEHSDNYSYCYINGFSKPTSEEAVEDFVWCSKIVIAVYELIENTGQPPPDLKFQLGSGSTSVVIINTPYGSLPGKGKGGQAWYSWHGKEYSVNEFQWLRCRPGFQVGTVESVTVPAVAVVGYQDDRGTIYSVICHTQGFGDIPGKSDGKEAWWSNEGNEYSTYDFSYVVVLPE